MSRLRTRLRQDGGVGLAEMLVVMMLLGLLGMVISTTVLQGYDATANADSRTRDAQQAKGALEAMTMSLRTATDPDGITVGVLAVEVAQPNEVQFYAALRNRGGTGPATDTMPVKVRYVRQSGSLVEETFAYDAVAAAWATTPTTRRVLARGVVGTRPVFTYLSAQDVPRTSDGLTVTTLTTSAGAVTGAERSRIGAVEMWLSVNSTPAKRPAPATVVDRVTLLNKQ